MQQRRIDAVFAAANVGDAQRKYTLDDFVNLGGGSRYGKEEAIDAACRWSASESIAYDDYDLPDPGGYGDFPRRSLVLYGITGTGKTTLANAAFRDRLAREGAGVRIEFYALAYEIQSRYGDSAGDDKSSMLLKSAQVSPVLMLDDLGDMDRVRMETDDKRRILYLILNHRVALELPTIITTNLLPDQFQEQFGERIKERLLQMAVWLPMDGVKLRPGVPA